MAIYVVEMRVNKMGVSVQGKDICQDDVMHLGHYSLTRTTSVSTK